MGPVEINPGTLTDGFGETGSLQIPTVDKLLQVDQGRVSCKGRKSVVGGVPVSGRAKGKNLPDTLARPGQKIDKEMGLFTQTANS